MKQTSPVTLQVDFWWYIYNHP